MLEAKVLLMGLLNWGSEATRGHCFCYVARISMQNKARQQLIEQTEKERETKKEKELLPTSEVPSDFHPSTTSKLSSMSLGLYSKEKVTLGPPVYVILEWPSSRKKN